VAVLGLVLVWAMLGPLRSQWAQDDSEAALAAGNPAKAAASAETASSRDPLSPEPLYDLAAARQASGDLTAAHGELRRAVRLAPRASDPWIHLGEFELDTLGAPDEAQHSFAAALDLDPHNPEAQDDFLRARQAVAAGS
jgi:Tfp pilus assembly protein PilF